VAEIEYLLNTAGLKMKKLKYIDFDYPNRGKIEAIINKAVGFIAPGLKSNIVIIGKKELLAGSRNKSLANKTICFR